MSIQLLISEISPDELTTDDEIINNIIKSLSFYKDKHNDFNFKISRENNKIIVKTIKLNEYCN